MRFGLREFEPDISAGANPEQAKQCRAELRHCQFVVNVHEKDYPQDKCPDKDLEAVETDLVVFREKVIHHPPPRRPCEVSTLPAIIRQPFSNFILPLLIVIQCL